MAAYRPIGLAPVGTSTARAGTASTYADRRRAAADRLLLAENLTTRLEAAVLAPDGSPIDPDGMLRACARALLPVAQRHPGSDVMVSLGPDHEWALRIRQDDDGPAVEVVPRGGTAHLTEAAGAPGAERAPGADRAPGASDRTSRASEAQIAADLARWLWTGEVSAR